MQAKSVLTALARKHRVPGLQFACHHGGVTTSWEVGELEFRTGRSVTPDTAFPVGSITKCFTATLTMILVADGDIDLDAPIGECLPDIDELGKVLSLRHLLSHTSGLTASPGTDVETAAALRRYVAEHIPGEDLVLWPGTGFSYSNTGYCLAGMLIEAITGMSWAEAVEAILLRPLGIEPAFAAATLPGPFACPVATGHAVNAAMGRTRAVQPARPSYEVPAGALAVSALDLVRLGSLHIGAGDPHLLPAAYAEQMRRAIPGAVPFGLADGWGLGLAVFGNAGPEKAGPEKAGREWVGHDGNAEGTACYLRINPADGCIIALTTNASTGGALWVDLLAELRNASFPVVPPGITTTGITTTGVTTTGIATTVKRPVAAPPSCAGKYVNGSLEYLVTADAGSAYLAIDGEAPAPLTVHADMTFSAVNPVSGHQVISGRFVPGPVIGSIQGMQIGGRFIRQLLPELHGVGRSPM